MTKKKIVSLCLAAVLVVMAIAGATVAYFTDTDNETNTFTIGNVKIDLIESTYHREGNDNSGDASIPNPTHTASGMEYVTDGHKAFTDDEIKTDAAKYKEYIGEKGGLMVPGRAVAKCPYVVNTGSNDAYIRIRVMVPSAANFDFVSVANGGVITNQWTTSCMLSGEFVAGEYTLGDGTTWQNAPAIERDVEKNGVKYDVYTFTRVAPLAAGAMTEWNVWNYIGIHKDATSADIQKAIDAKAIAEDGTLNVLVEADAIQAEGFADAAAAWVAFDA